MKPISDLTMFKLHTRHIPIEHLNLETQMGRDVVRNGLSDALDSPIVDKMREYGIDTVETRCVWYMLERERGKLDFSRLERDVEKIRKNGFRVGVFPWFQYPPEWERSMTRVRCLEHDQEGPILSLWEPGLMETYDRLYGALAERFGSVIDFLYFGVYGDYGEVQQFFGVQHYKFSGAHRHGGYWCGDALARADYVRHVREKYGSAAEANAAWKTQYSCIDDRMLCLPETMTLGQRRDFMEWYSGKLISFASDACRLIRRHFPKVQGGLPIGNLDESLAGGAIKSESARIAAENNITARWTGWAHLDDYARSFVPTRRMASAAKFYGADFGVEAALILTKENAWNAIYEAVSNDCTMIHNDPGNILRAPEAYDILRGYDHPERRRCDFAAFYPVEAEMMGLQQYQDFYEQYAKLRCRTDYEIADSLMLKRGFLKDFRHFILPDGCALPAETAALLREWSRQPGCVLYANGDPMVIETGEPAGLNFRSLSVLPEEKNWFDTDYGTRILRYNPQEQKIEFVEK